MHKASFWKNLLVVFFSKITFREETVWFAKKLDPQVYFDIEIVESKFNKNWAKVCTPHGVKN